MATPTCYSCLFTSLPPGARCTHNLESGQSLRSSMYVSGFNESYNYKST